ncbi:MAG: hypothetical protein AAFY88_04500 [Acidobacteriota bacterium]
MTLTEMLRNKAKTEGLAGQAEEEVFNLVAAEQCQQCCLLGSGGSIKPKQNATQS